jgi:hypothetical protein
MLIPLLLAALILLIAAIAYAVLGRDRLAAAWDTVPGPVRTVVNVFVAGAVLVVCAAVARAQGVTGVDWSATGEAALNAGALGVATAIFRAVNPLDDAYGLGKGRVVEGVDADTVPPVVD